MYTKAFDVKVKAVGTGDLKEGQFEAIVSVFGVEDSYGEVVMPGAFDKSLAEWAAKGDPVPSIFSHNWKDPMAHHGHAEKIESRPEGLWVRGECDDMDTNPVSAQIYRLLKSRRITQFSFAFDIVEAGWAERDGHEVYELRELKLIEFGPCLLGVNRETELLAAKAADFTSRIEHGMSMPAKALAGLRDQMERFLSATKSSDDHPVAGKEDETGQEPGAADDETGPRTDPETARKSSESPASHPMSPASVETLAQLIEAS